jgi:hypothetical protein
MSPPSFCVSLVPRRPPDDRIIVTEIVDISQHWQSRPLPKSAERAAASYPARPHGKVGQCRHRSAACRAQLSDAAGTLYLSVTRMNDFGQSSAKLRLPQRQIETPAVFYRFNLGF